MRAAHLGSSGSPERHLNLSFANVYLMVLRVAAVGTAFPRLTLENVMQTNTISATALEKLKRLAKQHRDISGVTLAESFEAVARQAGYLSWKQVTMLASAHKPSLMPADHRRQLHWVSSPRFPSMHRCDTVEELCELLGGVEPVLLRARCHESRPGARCICELDPFVTAKRANVAIDIGDKYDHWHYLYLTDRPYSGLDIVSVRVNLRLGSHGCYLNEHLLDDRNDDRSNSLNPNNDGHSHAANNHANQLNPNNERFSR
jgi:hypothetical protein